MLRLCERYRIVSRHKFSYHSEICIEAQTKSVKEVSRGRLYKLELHINGFQADPTMTLYLHESHSYRSLSSAQPSGSRHRKQFS